MKMRIAYNPATGAVGVFTEEGTFADGARSIDEVLGALESQGVEIESRTAAEQHRHDEERTHDHMREGTVA